MSSRPSRRMANADNLRQKVRTRSETAAERASISVRSKVIRASHAKSSPSSVGPQTIRRRRLSGAPTIAYSIQATSPVAVYTEKGTNAHIIRPRKQGGVLAFHWPRAGGTVFLRFVNHPGNEAMPWFKVTLEREWVVSLSGAFSRLR